MKGWLDKYGKEINANEGHSSAPDNWVGEGYSNVGRDYSPAWGGQFEDGGEIPKAQKGKRTPIYTDNPNDPRLRAYGDSTLMNLASMPIYKGTANIKSSGYFPDGRKSYGSFAVSDYYKNYPGFNKAQERLNYPDPKDVGYNWGYFPKPVQPVIYKEPTLKKKVTKAELLKSSKANTPGITELKHPDVQLPPIQQGKYRVEYFDPSLKEETHRMFMTQAESDTYADELSKRNLTGVPSAGNITQTVQYAMGGSIPGTVGFTYARTGGIPSNGPYAKKTKASAQKGKEVPIDPKTNPTYTQPVSEAIQFTKDWMNSPMYQKMLLQSFDGEKGRKYEDIDRLRKEAINDDNIDYYEESGDPSMGAESFSPIRGKSSIYFNTAAKYPNLLHNTTHELSHITDKGGYLIPKADKKLMESYAVHDIKESPRYQRAKEIGAIDNLRDFTNYVNKPTETRARINSFRKLLLNQGVYNPFTQPFSKDMLSKYKQLEISDEDKKAGYTIGADPYQQLKISYTDEEIEDMMNKISKADNKQAPVAENGMTFYQHGLDWKPKSMEKGGWLDKYEVPKNQNAEYVLPRYDMPINATDATGRTIPETLKQNAKAEEIHRRKVATEKQQFVGPAKASTPDSEARRKRLNEQEASKLPNVIYDKNTGELSRVNPDRGFSGEAQNFMSEREDKAAEHALGALEAAGYVEGLSALGSAAKKAVAQSMESGLLSKVKTYGNDLIQTSKSAGRLKLPTYQNVYRWQSDQVPEWLIQDGANLTAEQQALTGSWYTKDPSQLGFYMRTRPGAGNINTVRLSENQIGNLEANMSGAAKGMSGRPGSVTTSDTYKAGELTLPENLRTTAKPIKFDVNPTEYITPYGNYSEGSLYDKAFLEHQANEIVQPILEAQQQPIVGINRKYFPFKKGGVIKDDRGQWAHPGEITEIGSNRITMKGVDYPVLGISDKGDTQMMFPGEEYKFKGKKVTEFPMAQKGKTLPPIYTDDPRKVQAYNDSLTLSKTKSFLPVNPQYSFEKSEIDDIIKSNRIYDADIYDNPKNREAAKRLSKTHDEYNSVAPVWSRGPFIDYRGRNIDSYIQTFKKPVQPYILQQEPKLHPRVSDVQPINRLNSINLPGVTNAPQGMVDAGPIQQLPYRVDYRDDQGQPATRRFENEAASRDFFNDVRVPYTGIQGYYDKPSKKKNGGWLDKYK